MTQEPWNEEIYPTNTNSRKDRGKKATVSTRIFTFLITLFVLALIGITAVAVYLSNGGSKTDSTKEFYNTSSVSKAAASQASQSQAGSSSSTDASSSEATKNSDDETSSSSTTASSVAGETLTVESGEGAASIAARAGITVEELERLNPDKMTTGSWFAYPGDVVKIK